MQCASFSSRMPPALWIGSIMVRSRVTSRTIIKCKKCGGERRKYKPCSSPCEFGKGWVAPTKAEEDKMLRVFMEKQAKRQAAYDKKRAKQRMCEDRDKRAKSRADARVLAEAKAKKPKIMREREGMSVGKPTVWSLGRAG